VARQWPGGLCLRVGGWVPRDKLQARQVGPGMHEPHEAQERHARGVPLQHGGRAEVQKVAGAPRGHPRVLGRHTCWGRKRLCPLRSRGSPNRHTTGLECAPAEQVFSSLVAEVCLVIYLFIYLFVCLFVCLCVCLLELLQNFYHLKPCGHTCPVAWSLGVTLLIGSEDGGVPAAGGRASAAGGRRASAKKHYRSTVRLDFRLRLRNFFRSAAVGWNPGGLDGLSGAWLQHFCSQSQIGRGHCAEPTGSEAREGGLGVDREILQRLFGRLWLGERTGVEQ
jgi:hypothetical protein